MSFDQFRDLTAWMDEAGIDELELVGPSFRLRLGSSAPPTPDDPAVALDHNATPEAKPSRQIVAAPTVGLFLHRHPLHATMLAPQGTQVQAGQALGLLRVGPLLVPVIAPRDGIVGAMLVAHETVVGFGTGLVEFHHFERT